MRRINATALVTPPLHAAAFRVERGGKGRQYGIEKPKLEGPLDVLIIGAGIGGLTLALSLHQVGIPCRVFEASPEIKPLGAGINLLPHAMRELSELGLQDRLESAGVETRELCFYNRFGQFIFKEPRGRFAGYLWPQLSIHRGDLQLILLEAARERIGAERIHCGFKCAGVEQDENGVTAFFEDPKTGEPLASANGSIALGCDGIHSRLRKQLFPHEGPARYSGINMWRGVARCKPFLTGSSMALAGWLRTGKMVVYPIRKDLDSNGCQLINWVAEIETPNHSQRDWNRVGRLEDFIGAFEDWTFDWHDYVGMVKASETILEYPMVDQDPLPQWSFGRISLLGDAAHPMYPRGSNGAGQAILDARCLAGCLKRVPDPAAALKAYEAERLAAANKVVLMNRTNPPDAILREVDERTGGKPFKSIDDVISKEELIAISERYKTVAGFEVNSLNARASLV
jgi:2-polyprenyl-6-methoxyphenol hydroxylase-like FAD-dependent oxidoreductase